MIPRSKLFYRYTSLIPLIALTFALTSTPALTAAPWATTPVPTSVTLQGQAFAVLGPGLAANAYLITGADISAIEIGDDLIVYSELVRDTEVPIALLRVTAKNPSTLTAQTILAHPEREIRPSLRVDSNIDQLSTSELVPVVNVALGYVLRPGRIRLLPNMEVGEDALIEALEPEIIDGAIVDYLPFSPPIQMHITNIGIEGVIASTELITGEWPAPGTILVVGSGTYQQESIAEQSDEPNASPLINKSVLIHTKSWDNLAAESGTSQNWADLPTDMMQSIETGRSTLYIECDISRVQHSHASVNTEYRITVDGDAIAITNTGGHNSWNYRAIHLHGVTNVEAGPHIVRVEYRTEGGTEFWSNNDDGQQNRILTILELRP